MAHGRESVPSGGEFAVQCCYRRGAATASEGSGTCCGGPVRCPYWTGRSHSCRLCASNCSVQTQPAASARRAKTPVGRAAVGYARSRLQHGWTALRDVSQSASCAAKRPRAAAPSTISSGLSHCALRCDGACAAWHPRDGKDGLLPLPAEFERRPDELTARRGHREEPDGVWGAAARRGAHPESARVRRVGTRRPWSARVRHRRDRACSMACHAGTSPFAT